MRKTTFLFIGVILNAFVIATLLTIGWTLYKPYLCIIALWLLIPQVLVLTALVFKGYQRIVKRIRAANDMLAEVKYLQERRYEQLSYRLDNLTLGNANSTASRELSELEYLRERLQRAERRILGAVENENFRNDVRWRQWEIAYSELGGLCRKASDASGD